MKICVFGAGAVGGALAARLAHAGTQVNVIARGAHGMAMRRNGITLLTDNGRITAKVHCVEDSRELPPQDVVIVTVKGPALPGIAGALAAMTTSQSRVVFVMNGIPWWFTDGLGVPLPDAALDSLDPDARLRRSISLDQTIGGVVYSSNEVIEPGVIENTSPRNRIIMGRPDGKPDALVTALAAKLAEAGYDAAQVPDVRQHLWIKMLMVIGAQPVASLTGCALDRLTNDRGTRALMATLMREGLMLGRRLGFTLVDDIDERLDYYLDKPVRPSMLQDFELGRPPELESSILAFSALAKAIDLPAPTIDMVAALLRMKRAGAYGIAADGSPTTAAAASPAPRQPEITPAGH